MKLPGSLVCGLGLCALDGLAQQALPGEQAIPMKPIPAAPYLGWPKALALDNGTIRVVVVPAIKQPRGEPRVQALFDNWLAWANSPQVEGGCVFIGAATELDDRPGRLRDHLVKVLQYICLCVGMAEPVECLGVFHYCVVPFF